MTGAASFLLRALVCLLAWAGAAAAAAPREIALTFDDLPIAEADGGELTRRLVAALAAGEAPAVGFVNQGRLLRQGVPDPARVASLETWLDAGLELGNHTASHLSANRVPLESYREDIIRGEETVAALLAARGGRLRWFRPPYLHTGADAATREALAGFLAGRGYVLAPVTISNEDWVFAAAYLQARRRGLPDEAQRVADAYLEYSRACLVRAEALEMDLLGRPVRHVLLLHANALNAAALPRLLALLEGRGYRFVTLEHALQDDAYRRPDTVFRPPDEPWLERWHRAAGLRPERPPVVPAFVRQLAGPGRYP